MSKDGGSAFPLQDLYHPTTGDPCIQGSPGMSLRDYFAAHALAGILASTLTKQGHIIDMAERVRGGKFEAGAAYAYADAMLAEREKNDAK